MTIKKITSIIKNQPLASSIHTSISSALKSPHVHMLGGNTVWDVFQYSLKAAIRDIEKHPRGELFRRLIEFGPHHPDHPEVLISDGQGSLSDPECGLCVQFIFSHMVNRFKGELAELLAIEPCLTLVHQLQDENLLPENVVIFWGDMVQERHRFKNKRGKHNSHWGGFTKGADGLIAEIISSGSDSHQNNLRVHGVVEVKSMTLSNKKITGQINTHISRLSGGVKLGENIWSPDFIIFSDMLRILSVPSAWELSRDLQVVKTDKQSKILFPEHSAPPIQTQIEKLKDHHWKIKLAWSQEALEEAAYEMTFWYMSQVGKHVFNKRRVPKGWEYMTPEEAGYNAIKMMLYYLPLRYLSERQIRLAIKLYNIYSFGYPQGVDSKVMLWPEDLIENNG